MSCPHTDIGVQIKLNWYLKLEIQNQQPFASQCAKCIQYWKIVIQKVHNIHLSRFIVKFMPCIQ